ncbi:MAG: nuclear transport factor 2 family protein [Paracoccaceae bacterium]
MKLYDNWMKAFENRDFDEVMKFYHPDFSFIRHQTNTVMNLSEW